jgi:8-oxo-dGTP diphosphatase
VVLGRPRAAVRPHAANAESDDVRWVASSAVPDLPLHPGLAHSWPDLARLLTRLGH